GLYLVGPRGHSAPVGHSPGPLFIELYPRLHQVARALAQRADPRLTATPSSPYLPDAGRTDAAHWSADLSASVGTFPGGYGLPRRAGTEPACSSLSHRILSVAVCRRRLG